MVFALLSQMTSVTPTARSAASYGTNETLTHRLCAKGAVNFRRCQWTNKAVVTGGGGGGGGDPALTL